MNIYGSPADLIGHTPLVEFSKLARVHSCVARITGKLECRNPAGSVKDRVARAIIDQAEADGLLAPGATVIEPTSGNTGIALASLCAVKGYNFIAVMPDSMSIERRKLLSAYGAEIVLTAGSAGMKGAVLRAEELATEIKGAIIAGQFSNPANPEAHFKTTGPEIWRDTDGQIDIFVAGVGTGGTISGAGRYLRSRNPGIKIIAVEPASSPVLSGDKAGPHKIQGIGAGFLPDTLDTGIYDEVLAVKYRQALEMAREAARCEGLLLGISSGAALAAALDVGKLAENKGKLIVAVLPDGGERYLSTELFSQEG